MRFGKDTYVIAGLCVVGILLIFVLSWKGDPNLKGLPLIPSWLYNWTDSYGNSRIRTAVPFFFLALVIGAWFQLRRFPKRYYLISWVLLSGIVVLAEFGQYFIPLRDVDLKDIFWGSFGSFLGLAIAYAIRLFVQILKP